MTLKDVSKVISTSTYIIICQRIEYDNVKLPMKSNKLSYDELKWLVEKSDRIANMLVEDIFSRDNNLYICIY
jgi:hypothetical protein|nr:MAG TPA: hypothetical protein [Caudoviricetes sp.]